MDSGILPFGMIRRNYLLNAEYGSLENVCNHRCLRSETKANSEQFVTAHVEDVKN